MAILQQGTPRRYLGRQLLRIIPIIDKVQTLFAAAVTGARINLKSIAEVFTDSETINIIAT